jgi:hypothetical protein
MVQADAVYFIRKWKRLLVRNFVGPCSRIAIGHLTPDLPQVLRSCTSNSNRTNIVIMIIISFCGGGGGSSSSNSSSCTGWGRNH